MEKAGLALPGVFWKGNTVGHNQSRWFLEGVRDKFLTPVLNRPTRGNAQLKPLFTGKEEIVRDMIMCSIGHSYHEIVKVKILRVKKMTS